MLLYHLSRFSLRQTASSCLRNCPTSALLPISSCRHRLNCTHFTATRYISSTTTTKSDLTVENTTTPHSPPGRPETYVYNGPLTRTFRSLKIFSLSSLTLTFTLTPFMFLIESNLPVAARFVLAGMAVGTSGISTALVAWSGKPYVTTLRYMKPAENDGVEGIEMTTLTLALHPRITRVYDSKFLVPTTRGFAKWELAQTVTLPPPTSETDTERVLPGDEETVAETFDKGGGIIGRWIVKWGENGIGTCREEGKVVRYFNVHEELLH